MPDTGIPPNPGPSSFFSVIFACPRGHSAIPTGWDLPGKGDLAWQSIRTQAWGLWERQVIPLRGHFSHFCFVCGHKLRLDIREHPDRAALNVVCDKWEAQNKLWFKNPRKRYLYNWLWFFRGHTTQQFRAL